MNAKERQKKATGIVFGILLITVGVLFTLDSMGVIEAGRLSRYWPLLLIGSGLPSLIAPKDSSEPVWGVILTSLGAFFLMRKFDLIGLDYWDVWPLLLVLAGVTLLAQSLFKRGGRDRADTGTLPEGGAR